MKSNKRRRVLFALLGVLAFLILLTQLQPEMLQLAGAVDGSFGLRPITHKCAGLTPSGDWVEARLSPADWQTKLGRFSLRWYVPEEAGGRDFCLGQDVWYGE